MKKLILTEEVVKSLDFLYTLAERFAGFPITSSHLQTIKDSIVEEEEKDNK